MTGVQTCALPIFLSREKVDGTYESLQLNEDALESIIESGSKVMRAYNFIGDWVLDENKGEENFYYKKSG